MNCAECGGACCETLAVEKRELDTFEKEFFSVRGEPFQAGYLLECRCPELTENGRCGIYERRPLICRTYPAGGKDCLETVRLRRTPEDYQRIREDGDPESIH